MKHPLDYATREKTECSIGWWLPIGCTALTLLFAAATLFFIMTGIESWEWQTNVRMQSFGYGITGVVAAIGSWISVRQLIRTGGARNVACAVAGLTINGAFTFYIGWYWVRIISQP
jgi:hypothetical protein